MNPACKTWNEVLSIINGKNQKAVEDINGAYPIYGSGGVIGRAKDYLCEAGTTIIGRKGTINSPIFVNERFWNVDTAFGITPGDALLPKYLYYFCRHFNFKSLDKSTTIPSLAKGDLLSIEMPVPSLEEQECIVSRIEELFSELDAGVKTLQKIKQQLAIYRQAVLDRAFEGIDSFVSIHQIAERVFDGPFGSNLKTADYSNSGVRVVRLENLKNGWFDDSKKSYVTETKYEAIKEHTLIPTDLIMSTFISENIKICKLPTYIGFAVNKADCVGIRLKPDIEPKFVMYYLSSKKAYKELIHHVHGATRPRVNTKQIKAICVPIVGIERQREIISMIESRFSVCESIEKTVDEAMRQSAAMRQSILKQAFEGGLQK